MATAPRRPPLVARAHTQILPPTHKRPRSPANDLADHPVVKRLRDDPPAATTANDTLLRKYTLRRAEPAKLTKDERERQKEEFRIKYTEHFPKWVFYFDPLDASRDAMEPRVQALGARVEDFFCAEVTHVITMQARTAVDVPNKENAHTKLPLRTTASLKSPIKLRGRAPDENNLATKALQFKMKLWTPAKLESVLERLNDAPAKRPTVSAKRVPDLPRPSQTLNSLLQNERRHGVTQERDPTARRHGYMYFDRHSHFVLVEDMLGQLATIAVQEYPKPAPGEKERDKRRGTPWPTLYADPRARCPFEPYDAKVEAKRLQQELEREIEDQELEAAKYQLKVDKARAEQVRATLDRRDLRRCASLNNLHHAHAPHADPTARADAQAEREAPASGFLASGLGLDHSAYWAASGNSYSVASTAGDTTSLAGVLAAAAALPAALREKVAQQHVFRRPSAAGLGGDAASVAARELMMMPPPPGGVRRTKSMSTLRMHGREEPKRSGFCENCRIRFDCFVKHLRSRKHRKYAEDPLNFAELDTVLSRLERRPKVMELV